MSRRPPKSTLFIFFFNDTATTEIYTLSLHDALPISPSRAACHPRSLVPMSPNALTNSEDSSVLTPSLALRRRRRRSSHRSEEHTSELQSRQYLVCRLLLE